MAIQDPFELPEVYDTLHVGVAAYDPDAGTILAANGRFEAITGYTIEALCDLSIEEYTANTYVYSAADFEDRLAASASGTAQQFTWRIKRADGELVWVQIHLAARTVAGRSCVLAEARDITTHYETRHREQLLWRVIRHNLRNDASALLGYADRIERNATDDTVREASEVVQSRAEQLGNMADSLTEIERAIECTQDNTVRQHATTAVKDVVESVSTRHPEADITVREREPMWADIGDAFTYALAEALENAIRHGETSTPNVRVEIGPSPNTGRVEVRISDTNPPIPEAEIAALRTPDDTTPVYHGSGVGLFVMKWGIESLGGEIKFEGDESRGNAVFFYLPPKTPEVE